MNPSSFTINYTEQSRYRWVADRAFTVEWRRYYRNERRRFGRSRREATAAVMELIALHYGERSARPAERAA